MKRIATAAVAATLSLTAVATPAIAQETENTGSSAAYQECKERNQKIFDSTKKLEENADTNTGKGLAQDAREKALGENNSSTVSGSCIKELTQEDSEYRSSVLGLLIGVPVALIALLGAAAAFSGAIPGVELPALPF